jgi:hypothetical protein
MIMTMGDHYDVYDPATGEMITVHCVVASPVRVNEVLLGSGGPIGERLLEPERIADATETKR